MKPQKENIARLKLYYLLFSELWKYFREFSDPDDSDEFWKNMLSRGSAIADSFKESGDPEIIEFSHDMVLETMKHIQRIYRKRRSEAHISILSA